MEDAYRQPAEREPEPPPPWNRAKMSLFASVAFFVAFVIWGATRLYVSNVFDEECAEYIGAAVTSTNIDSSISDLESAISFAEENELTEGYTSIFGSPPGEDVSRWYDSMVDVRDKLEELRRNDFPTVDLVAVDLLKERSFALTKLHLSAYPKGISVFPHNTLFLLWGVISGLGAVGFCIAYQLLKPTNEWW